MFVVWLRRFRKGIGNGISLIIFTGIVARIPGNCTLPSGIRSAPGAIVDRLPGAVLGSSMATT